MPARWRPAREWLNIRDEMDHLFNEFLSKKESKSTTGQGWSPNTDVLETDNDIIVTVEIPGVKKDDVKLSLHDNILTIRGDKKADEKEKGEIYYRVERNFGTFNRSFDLPCSVDLQKIQANFLDGVLRIKLPKTAESKIRDIPISID